MRDPSSNTDRTAHPVLPESIWGPAVADPFFGRASGQQRTTIPQGARPGAPSPTSDPGLSRVPVNRTGVILKIGAGLTRVTGILFSR